MCRKLFGIARQVGSRGGFVALINLLLGCGKVFGDVRHLLAGAGQFGIFLAGSDAVADEKQVAGALLLADAVAGILANEGRGQHPQRTGIGDVGIVDPVVGLWVGDDQRLKIQVVQAAVGDDEHLRIIRQQRLRRRDERAVEGASIFAGFENVLRTFEGRAIALHHRLDVCTGRQRKQDGLLRRDRPQVRLLLSQPVEKKHALRVAGNLVRIQRQEGRVAGVRGSLREQAQPLGESASPAVVGPAQGLVWIFPAPPESERSRRRCWAALVRNES